MAVSAATAVTVFATVVMSAAVAAVFAMTATASGEMFYHVLNLLIGSRTVFQNRAFEVQCLSCQRMVQVDLHLLFTNFYNTSVEALPLFVLQGNDGILIDVLMVEVTVDAEYFALQVENVLRLVVPIGLLFRYREIEGVVLLQINDLAFKCVECHSETCNKLEGAFCWSLFHHLLVVSFADKQLVAQGDILILLFHI